jgi:hypothetical protein
VHGLADIFYSASILQIPIRLLNSSAMKILRFEAAYCLDQNIIHGRFRAYISAFAYLKARMDEAQAIRMVVAALSRSFQTRE